MTCAIVTIVRTNRSGERPASEHTGSRASLREDPHLRPNDSGQRLRPGRGTVPWAGAGARDCCGELGHGRNRNVCPLGVGTWGVSRPAGAVTAPRAPTLAG